MTTPRLTKERAAEADETALTVETDNAFLGSYADMTLLGRRILDLLDRVEQAERVAAEGRAAGRMEAAAILLRQSAEAFPPDKLVRSQAIGCSGDYGVEWVESEVLALFDAGNAPATKSLIEQLDGAFWSVVSDLESAKERAEQAERDRDEALQELRNIATAQPNRWDVGLRDQFQPWAQSRACDTVQRLTRATPAEGGAA